MSVEVQKNYEEKWKLYYEKDLNEVIRMLHVAENGSIDVANAMNSIKIQLALVMRSTMELLINAGDGPNKCDLAFYYVLREIDDQADELNPTLLYQQAAIQVSIYRVINWLLGELDQLRFQEYAMDAYQEAFFHFGKIIRRYRLKERSDGNEVPQFLMYIEQFLRLRLKHWYLVNTLGYTYNRDWRKKDENPYKRRILPLQGDCIFSSIYQTSVADKHDSFLAMCSFEDMMEIVRMKKPLQATCLELHYGEDMTLKEVAKKLAIPENTVKSHVARGKKLLMKATNVA
ncbi:RNA polymerase sigma factor [Brevibacillus reuszeri]|uniref:RNA polymerase sigma factor n=1 Tax=Brevibacillus reuszeri TaxID=54915 RepID=UPI003D1CA20B